MVYAIFNSGFIYVLSLSTFENHLRVGILLPFCTGYLKDKDGNTSGFTGDSEDVGLTVRLLRPSPPSTCYNFEKNVM